MLNSTIVSNITGALPPNQKVSSGLRSSLLTPVEFTMTEVKSNSSSEQRKYMQRSSPGKASSNAIFNGQKKGGNLLDQNKNPQMKMQLLNGNRNGVEADDSVPTPKVCLYSGRINPEWQKSHKIGAGLINLGNTCFMNTVLQCLTYTPPLANYLLHDSDHATKCKVAGFCMMCELQQHMKKAIDRPGDVFKPVHIYQKLKSIAKHFQFGRQEDAHEFLRYVIDNLWKACLTSYDGYSKLDAASKETTVINQIFGGYHRSQVTCLRCREKSNTYDHFMDFILDVKQNVVTLEKALEKFIQPELLQNENAYKCPQCKMKVSAQKKFSVYKAPNVATFQFKRFDYHRMCGGKITKHISYPENLNLRPYMSVSKGGPVWYRLNAVLVHLGPTCNSGHYFCYVRNSNGFWYLMDDARVQQVSLNQVLNQVAYVLFYIRVNSENLTTKRPAEHAASIVKHNHVLKNGYVDRANCASPHAIVRPALSLKSSPLPGISKLSISATKSSLCNGSTANANAKQVLQPLSQNREKISFSVGPTDNANKLFTNSKQKTESTRGAVQSTPAVNNNKSVLNGNILVPYIEDSDSSDDAKNDNVSVCSEKKSSGSDVQGPCPSPVPKEPIISDAVFSSKVKTPKPEENDENLVLKAKSKCSSSSKQSFNDSTCRTAALSQSDRKVFNRSLNTVSNDVGPKKDPPSIQSKSVDNVPSRSPSVSQDSTSTVDNLFDATSSFVPVSLAKVNATCPQWTATDISLHSPSIASGSSTNSVNSTTDWNVADQESSRKKERSWTVQIRSVDRAHKPQKSEASSAATQLSKTATPSLEKSISKETKVKEEVIDVVRGIQNSVGSMVSNGDGIKSNSNVAAEVEFMQPMESKKPVTGKVRSLDRPPTPFRTINPPVADIKKPAISKDNFQNQPFHAPRGNSFLGQGKFVSPNRQQQRVAKVQQEQSSLKRPICDVTKDASEERPTGFHDSDETGDGPVPKKLKADHDDIEVKRKQHPSMKNHPPTLPKTKSDTAVERESPKQTKRDLSAGKNDPEMDCSSTKSTKDSSSVRSVSSADAHPSPEKKGGYNRNDKSYSMHKVQHRTWKSPKKSDSDSESIKSNKSVGKVSSTSSTEYEWVEKTKETIGPKGKGRNGSWDIKKYTGRNDKGTYRNSFDHVQDNSHRNSNYIFGTEVGTWDNSTRDEVRVPDNSRGRYFDAYDEELDRGKERRRKKHHYDIDNRNNPFEEFSRNKRKGDFENFVPNKPFGQNYYYPRFYGNRFQDMFSWGSWRPKPYYHRRYPPPFNRRDKFYDRHRRTDFKYHPKMQNKHHRHYHH